MCSIEKHSFCCEIIGVLKIIWGNIKFENWYNLRAICGCTNSLSQLGYLWKFYHSCLRFFYFGTCENIQAISETIFQAYKSYMGKVRVKKLRVSILDIVLTTQFFLSKLIKKYWFVIAFMNNMLDMNKNVCESSYNER